MKQYTGCNDNEQNDTVGAEGDEAAVGVEEGKLKAKDAGNILQQSVNHGLFVTQKEKKKYAG